MRIDDLLGKLSGVRDSVKNKGHEWTSKCPAHEDGSASLSIGLSGDKILLKCHAGCETNKICLSIGVRMSDLQGSSPSSKSYKREIESVYDYVDESGKLIYQSVRYRPKVSAREGRMEVEDSYLI